MRRAILILFPLLLVVAPSSTTRAMQSGSCGDDLVLAVPTDSLEFGQMPELLAIDHLSNVDARLELPPPLSATSASLPGRVLLQDYDQRFSILDIESATTTPLFLTPPTDSLFIVPSNPESSIAVAQYQPEEHYTLIDLATGDVDALVDRIPIPPGSASGQQSIDIAADGGLVAVVVGNSLYAGIPFSADPLTLLSEDEPFPEVTMSLSGDRLAYRTTDPISGMHEIIVLNADLTEQLTIEDVEAIGSFVFSGSDRLVGSSEEGLLVVDLDTGTQSLVAFSAPMAGIFAISTDGTRVLVGATGSMILADVETGETFAIPDVEGFGWNMPDLPSQTLDRIVADGSQTEWQRVSVVDLLADPLQDAVRSWDTSEAESVLVSASNSSHAIMLEQMGNVQEVSVLDLANGTRTLLAETGIEANILMSPDQCQISIGDYPELANDDSAVMVFGVDGVLQQTLNNTALVGWARGV